MDLVWTLIQPRGKTLDKSAQKYYKDIIVFLAGKVKIWVLLHDKNKVLRQEKHCYIIWQKKKKKKKKS